MQIYLPSYARAIALRVSRIVSTTVYAVGAIAAGIGIGCSLYAHWLALKGIAFGQGLLFYRLLAGIVIFAVLECLLNYGWLPLKVQTQRYEAWLQTYQRIPRSIRVLYSTVQLYCFGCYFLLFAAAFWGFNFAGVVFFDLAFSLITVPAYVNFFFMNSTRLNEAWHRSDSDNS